jgi:hypothetical protein
MIAITKMFPPRKAGKMNEHEAWIFLADKWDKPEVTDRRLGYYCIRIRGIRCDGLCNSIIIAATSNDVVGVMLNRLYKLGLKRQSNGFFFPLDRAGARKRAALCRRFAKMTARAG